MAKYRNYKSFEGQQYRGGRESGRKNLRRTEQGNLINQHGVEFTPEEKRALENAVNSVNRKRARMIEEWKEMPRFSGGRKISENHGELKTLGKESDMLIAKRSKSLQSFESKREYETYMRSLNRAKSTDYIDYRVGIYKSNYMKALKNEFGDEATDIYNKIRRMPRAKFRELVERDELAEIGYVYGPDTRLARLNNIRDAFGLPLKEEYTEIVE